MEHYENVAVGLLLVGALAGLTARIIELAKRNDSHTALLAVVGLICGAVFHGLGWSIPYLLALSLIGIDGVWYLKRAIGDTRRDSNIIRRSELSGYEDRVSATARRAPWGRRIVELFSPPSGGRHRRSGP